MITELESRAAAQLPALAPAGTRSSVKAVVDGVEVEVHCRAGRHGGRVFGYACHGVRLERRTLLMLLCPEAACDAARDVRERFAALVGSAAGAARSAASPRVPGRPRWRPGVVPRAPSTVVQPLVEEVPIRSGEAVALQTPAELHRVREELAADLATCDGVYLTVCLDVLPAAQAPGVSAPAVLGVPLWAVETLLDDVLAAGKLVLADIAELNPALDRDGLTARTAARLAARIARALGTQRAP